MTAIRQWPGVTVILPCYNEAAAIAQVVADFRAALPGADIVVFDNASTDGTAEMALAAGAQIIMEPIRGKGSVVRRAFAELDADVYVMADGDGTYHAASAPLMVEMLRRQRLDMVIGIREDHGGQVYPPGHRVGNRLFNHVVAALFGRGFTDIFSGYRVLSHRFVKSFPALSEGFEIETELAVHALQLRLPTAELGTPYGERSAGTESKLKTWSDGWRIGWAIVKLTKQHRPFLLFSWMACLLCVTSLALGIPIVMEFLATGLVPRLPTAVLAMGIMLLAALAFTTGLVLHGISVAQAETRRLHYLRA
ncbi:MAG: glycosyltransferase [Rhodospirillaceae bacterium]|nr:glycosyltransferase [Rhodospirillales bacterium]